MRNMLPSASNCYDNDITLRVVSIFELGFNFGVIWKKFHNNLSEYVN